MVIILDICLNTSLKVLFSNDYRKHNYKRKIYNEEASRVEFLSSKDKALIIWLQNNKMII